MANLIDQLKRPRTTADNKQSNPVAVALFIIILLIGTLASWLTGQLEHQEPFWLLVSLPPALYVLFALKIANQWEKAVVLRLGKFIRLAGPGPSGLCRWSRPSRCGSINA